VLEADRIFLGSSRHTDDSLGDPQYLTLKYANRHGLVTGATGTGKTVSLQVLAEGFSRAGVPVFTADVKGDLSGIAEKGEAKDALAKRAADIGFADEYALAAVPAIFWDLFGEKGHRVRATISEMGPLLLSRLLDLNPTQEGVLNIAFKLADEESLLLLDLKDLQALLANMAERADELTGAYGNVSKASVGAIQRQLLVLEQQGGEEFFGEPALEIADLMRTTPDGRGIVGVLAADRLMQSPRLYATFLLWLMSELFEVLPEVGDPEKPRLVFFFDEAHLLFAEAPKALIEKVEQVVKLIRSKGVGVYFVTQNPIDIPDNVLAQLGNRVQHALRAFTPREQRAVDAAADTFRPNPEFKVGDTITRLGVGEALVSTLASGGVPSMVERTLIRPPSSRLGPITDAERKALIDASPVGMKYTNIVDRESAYERLKQRAADAAPPARTKDAPRAEPAEDSEDGPRARSRTSRDSGRSSRQRDSGGIGGAIIGEILGGGSRRQSVAEAAVKSVVRSVGSSLGREIVRGILGSLRR
jgi:DNA helicase HerA-like ATPase